MNLINANTKARIALFNRVAKEDDKPGVTYPAMFGSIENKDFKINVSAFLKVNTTNGKKFLSLVIRNEHDEQTFAGTLHRSEKAGKEDTYYGYISEQFQDEVDGKTVYSNSDWQIGISAKVKKADSGRKYIGGDVYPLNKTAGTTSATSTPAADEELAF